MSNGVATAVGISTNAASVEAVDTPVASIVPGGALNAIFNIPKASDLVLGGIKIPVDGVIEIDSDGNIYINEDAIKFDLEASATVDSNIGTPDVIVTPSELNGKQVLKFAFKNLKGEKGEAFKYSDFTEEQLNNLKGKDGITPIKGTHYWTESDKEEIVEDVLNALPNGNEVAY